MTNLFLIFDPRSSFFSIPLNWVSLFLVIPILPSIFWGTKRIFFFTFTILLKTLEKEFSLPIIKLKTPGIRHFFISIFLFILLNNFLGLFPYIFTASRHIRFPLILALSIWIGYILFSTVKNINRFLSHLLPLGTPYPLIPFMVIIELISNIIRPLTLSVRLAANIVAGHLLIVLIRAPLASIPYFIFRITLLVLLLLITLEVGVSFIQAYVFRTLISLYIIEVNSPNL